MNVEIKRTKIVTIKIGDGVYINRTYSISQDNISLDKNNTTIIFDNKEEAKCIAAHLLNLCNEEVDFEK